MADNENKTPYPVVAQMQNESFPQSPPPYSETQHNPSAMQGQQQYPSSTSGQPAKTEYTQMPQQNYQQPQQPQQNYPQPQMPQQNYPQPQMPQQNYPQPQMPQQNYHQPQMPQQQPPMYAPQQQMQQTTNIIVTNQPQSQTTFVQPITLEHNWLVPAILSCLFCFWPTGIAAIMAANNAQHAAAVGDVNGAYYYSSRARYLTILSVFLGIAWIIVVIATSV